MMDALTKMLGTHPNPGPMDQAALAECIAACLECAGICTLCSDACLNEKEHLPHLLKCVTLNSQCAATCAATAAVLSRPGLGNMDVMKADLQACLAACRACAEECEHHAKDMGMKHCGVCAESCRRCEKACQALLA